MLTLGAKRSYDQRWDMIRNDEELRAVVREIGDKLQDVTSYLGDRNCPDGCIRFPTGYLRHAEPLRNSYSFIRDHTLQRNISYCLLGTDVVRWLLNRTTLMGLARGMVIKQGLTMIASVLESVTKDYLLDGYGGAKGYPTRLERLVTHGVIDEALKTELRWVWDQRQGIHLYLCTDLELDQYTVADYNRAVRAMQGLREKCADKGVLPRPRTS